MAFAGFSVLELSCGLAVQAIVGMLKTGFDDDVQTAAHILAGCACDTDTDTDTCVGLATHLPDVPSIVDVFTHHAANHAAKRGWTAATATRFDPLATVTPSQDIAATLALVIGNIVAAAAAAAASTTAALNQHDRGRVAEYAGALGRHDFLESLLGSCGYSVAARGATGEARRDLLGARACLRCVAQLCEAHPDLCAKVNENNSALKACAVCALEPFLASHAERAKYQIEAAVMAASSSSSSTSTTSTTSTTAFTAACTTGCSVS
jgi:hypothetical protein